jgi:DNA-binding phage protein
MSTATDETLARVRATLKRVENLSDFAKRANLPRSTLDHLRNSGAGARAGTLALVEQALKRHRPKLLPEEDGG